MSYVKPPRPEPLRVYSTPINGAMSETTGPSVDTGFQSLDDARAIFGEPVLRMNSYLVYPDVILSYFPWSYTE